MNTITKIISTAITSGARVLKVLGFGRADGDVREVKEAMPFGLDSNPVKGMSAILAETTANGSPVVIGYINKNQLAEVGGSRLYSTDSDGAVQIALYLRADGTMEIGGNANHMTQYEGMKDAYDELRDDLNDLISKFNSHTHPYTNVSTPATTSPTATTATPSSADMSGAKLDNIKTQ